MLIYAACFRKLFDYTNLTVKAMFFTKRKKSQDFSFETPPLSCQGERHRKIKILCMEILNCKQDKCTRGPFHKTILWLGSIIKFFIRSHQNCFTKLSYLMMIMLRSVLILWQSNIFNRHCIQPLTRGSRQRVRGSRFQRIRESIFPASETWVI